MPQRTLVATMGTDDRQVLPAMRLMPYDRLVLVAAEEAFESAGFRRLEAIEPLLHRVPVDPYDFLSCLEAVRQAVREASRDGPVRMSVGGGSKILSSAAILAAFQEGVEAWYCDPEPIRLPVLRGIRLVEAFAREEQTLGRLVRGPVALDRLVRSAARHGLSRYLATRAVRSLTAKGLLDMQVVEGTIVVRPTAVFPALRPHLRGPPGKA